MAIIKPHADELERLSITLPDAPSGRAYVLLELPEHVVHGLNMIHPADLASIGTQLEGFVAQQLPARLRDARANTVDVPAGSLPVGPPATQPGPSADDQ